MGERVYRYGGVRARDDVLRWAAFFDAAGWSWSYRSHDLGGYAPPFLVQIPALDDAWAAVIPSRRFEEIVAGARRELEQVRIEGYALALGAGPLGRDVIGGIACYPRAAWEPLTAARAGLRDSIADTLREAYLLLRTHGVADRPVTPEIYGGTRFPDWRSRGEALARRWGTPEQIRDWGLLVAEVGAADPLVAGVLAGVSKGHLTDESLDVWLPARSVRTAILRALGARPRQLVDRLFHVTLQVIVEATDDPSELVGR